MNNNESTQINFEEISEKEYDFYKKILEPTVFDKYYKQGMSHKLAYVNYEEKFLEDNPFEKVYQKEESTKNFLSYAQSLADKERMLNFFSKDVIEKKCHKDNKYFKVFLEQIDMIDQCISPILKELNIDYQIYLTGGALRDHIIDKSDKVKDLDILIEFSDSLYIEKMHGKNSLERRNEQNKTIKDFIDKNQHIFERYNITNLNCHQSREKILHEIVFQSVNQLKNADIKNFLLWKEDNTMQEHNVGEKIMDSKIDSQTEVSPDDSILYDGVFSVIKVNGNQYPMDLLLNSNRLAYLYYFDFNICKCLYAIKKLETNDNESNLYLDEGFIEDVIQKKLSLNAQIFNNNEQVDRCLKDHYIRLQTKYDDYKINIIEKNMNGKEELLLYIHKSHQYYFLENKLNKNIASVKTKKIKI